MRFLVILLRLTALLALTLSSALLADEVAGAGELCGHTGDCGAVSASVYGRPLGVPLSAVGAAGFALLFVLTLVPGRGAWWAVRLLALVAGLAAAALLVIQFVVLGQVCPLCVAVDVSGLVAAVLAMLSRPVPTSRIALVVWLVAGAVAVVVPMCWSALQLAEPVPERIKAQWVPGRVTVVEMTDFECPHCRRADAVVREVRGRHDIRLVRLVVPMDMHLNARHAGRAYLAALRQGKEEEMAAALYADEAPTAERCRQLAGQLGLDLAEYDRALQDPAIDAELYANVRLSRELGKGVPVIWVQDRRLTGNPTAEELAAALDDAIRKAQPPGP